MNTTTSLDIRVASTAAEARAALADGYEPVECAFGSESVVGPLGLDHHGELSDRPPVSQQAWQEVAYATRHVTTRERVVVTGTPDADASICISLLSRIGVRCADGNPAVDHGSPRDEAYHRLVESVVALVAASDVGDWKDLAQEGRAGAIILAWGARQRSRRLIACPCCGVRADVSTPSAQLGTCGDCYEDSAFRLPRTHAAYWVSAVNDWAELLALPYDGPNGSIPCRGCEHQGADYACEHSTAAELVAAHASEAERVRLAREAWASVMALPYGRLKPMMDSGCVLIESPVMGADVWYADHPRLRGYVAYWETPAGGAMYVSLRPGTALPNVSLCTSDAPDTCSSCGYADGLRALLDGLPRGMDGRPEILGSRGVKITRNDAVRAVKLLAERIDEVAR